MTCPICEREMVPGNVFLQKATSSALLFGFGSRELYFKSDSDGTKSEEMDAWDTNAAYKCDGCGALLIAGEPRG